VDGEILGSGCANCAVLERRTREALADLNLTTEIKVTDYGDVAGYGVLRTPALVVDEQVLLARPGPRPRRVAGLLARWPQRHDRPADPPRLRTAHPRRPHCARAGAAVHPGRV
jgi:hypothetical protein